MKTTLIVLAATALLLAWIHSQQDQPLIGYPGTMPIEQGQR